MCRSIKPNVKFLSFLLHICILPKSLQLKTGGLACLLDSPDVFDYADIPNFPLSTAPGHKSRLLMGKLHGTQVMLMQGRYHHYEGYPMQLVSIHILINMAMKSFCLLIIAICGISIALCYSVVCLCAS